ncbi:MAG: hypothetical protein COV91_03075 [Candidatus Taylorbacteria bacterium CG11_big_fil_rev_8_21_14_0_20_46_11]|uniref:Uncharacterized protein n=1 Tax=Candidatus Taylorbacteria bacterium CG11_big_fil_rev_8_21_14_0_20_46_11 TaxID=1975025 RepID=A0A2H0KBI2_9BACT|nr:MAG: hypothetical protein COV91_03075 [Candidatus Taylorbacteria bacterium CG11_big_fil_rev_8_21_14_0_20_46_11]
MSSTNRDDPVYTGPRSTTIVRNPREGDNGWRGESVRKPVKYCKKLGGWVAPEAVSRLQYAVEYIGTD